MRAVPVFSLLMSGVIALLCFPVASVAQPQQSVQPVPESADDDAAPGAESVTSRIAKLSTGVTRVSRDGLEILIRSRKLKSNRPRYKADEDTAARARRQQNLDQWVSEIDAMQSELRAHKTELDEIKARIREIRNLDMNDEDIDALVQLELGVHNLAGIMRRGTRELASARRRGVNAMDGSQREGNVDGSE